VVAGICIGMLLRRLLIGAAQWFPLLTAVALLPVAKHFLACATTAPTKPLRFAAYSRGARPFWAACG
jgi:hypothetical protein